MAMDHPSRPPRLPGRVRLPPGGHYVVVLFLRRACTLAVGRKGDLRFRRGWYLYVGRARRGLGSRLGRHLSPGPRKQRWHIDALASSPHARAAQARVLPLYGFTECGIMGWILEEEGARVPVPGFGSSDCKPPCPAHLVWFPDRRAVEAVLRRLDRRVAGTGGRALAAGGARGAGKGTAGKGGRTGRDRRAGP